MIGAGLWRALGIGTPAKAADVANTIDDPEGDAMAVHHGCAFLRLSLPFQVRRWQRGHWRASLGDCHGWPQPSQVH